MNQDIVEINSNEVISFMKDKEEVALSDIKEKFGYGREDSFLLVRELIKKGYCEEVGFRKNEEKSTAEMTYRLTEEGKKITNFPNIKIRK